MHAPSALFPSVTAITANAEAVPSAPRRPRPLQVCHLVDYGLYLYAPDELVLPVHQAGRDRPKEYHFELGL